MPVDTRNKRASVLGTANPPFVVYPNPAASIPQAARQQTAYTYAGIAAASPSVVTIPPSLALLGVGI